MTNEQAVTGLLRPVLPEAQGQKSVVGRFAGRGQIDGVTRVTHRSRSTVPKNDVFPRLQDKQSGEMCGCNTATSTVSANHSRFVVLSLIHQLTCAGQSVARSQQAAGRGSAAKDGVGVRGGEGEQEGAECDKVMKVR